MGSGKHVETAVLVAGFEAARSRLEQSPQAGDESFHALFEIVAWVGGIRDRLKPETCPELEGLYYVRNSVIHHGSDVIYWLYEPGSEPGRMIPGRSRLGTATKMGWWWPAFEDVPPPTSGAGAREYEEQLAGREVRLTLVAVSRWLRESADAASEPDS